MEEDRQGGGGGLPIYGGAARKGEDWCTKRSGALGLAEKDSDVLRADIDRAPKLVLIGLAALGGDPLLQLQASDVKRGPGELCSVAEVERSRGKSRAEVGTGVVNIKKKVEI